MSPEHPELLDGCGPLEVGPHQERLTPLLLEPAGELGRRRRLPGALQTGQEHDGRRLGGVRDAERLAPEDRHQLLVDDLDDLLCRGQALGQVGADAALPHLGHETTDDREVDVRLQEGEADLAEGLVDLGLPQAAAAPQTGENPLEAIG